MQEKKEHIKTRMLKNAARIGGYPETEAESIFDPLVSMLLGAFASELEKVSAGIEASRARVLERLVQLLSPDVLTGALPAHAVVRALPVEHTINLYEDAQFYTSLKLPAVNETDAPSTKDIFFSPTATFQLNRASVKFMVAGNRLFKVNDTAAKEVIAYSSNSNYLPPSTLWLGIDEPGVSLHDSLFYFDLRNQANKQLFYHHLPKAKWFYGSSLLEHLPGYGNKEICGETLDVENILRNEHNVGGKIKQQINAFYKPYFITVNDNDGTTEKQEIGKTPEAILQAFPNNEAGQLQQEPLRWISIRFPDAVSNHLLQDVTCTINCFPVVNRKLHDINYRLQELINIIPLNTDDLFLDLQEVSNHEGTLLDVHSSHKDSNEAFATLMRNGGIGRFDERDAAAIIDYLIQLLQDESAAFSIMDKDFVSSEIRQLQQVLNKLEQKLFSRHIHKGSTPYLVINSDQKLKGKNLVVKYWSTNGQQANNIKAATSLKLHKGCGPINNNSVLLVSSTKGGRDKLSATDKVLAYKSALLSKERIITTEDIRAFCYYQLGGRAKRVTVQKGVMTLPGWQQGFKRTIDVVVELHERAYDDIKEKGELNAFWEENLLLMLEEKSAALMQYRVIVKQAA